MSDEQVLKDVRYTLSGVNNEITDEEVARWLEGSGHEAAASTKGGMRLVRAAMALALHNIAAPVLAKQLAKATTNDGGTNTQGNEPTFGPNQARYEQCAKPHLSQLQANDAMRQFLAHVGDVRAHYQVPEVIVVAAAYFGDKPAQTVVQAAGFGDARTHPELGALAFKQCAAPAIMRAQRLQQMAGIVTDRNAPEEDDEDGLV